MNNSRVCYNKIRTGGFMSKKKKKKLKKKAEEKLQKKLEKIFDSLKPHGHIRIKPV